MEHQTIQSKDIYFKKINNGNVYAVLLPKLFPLLLWGYFIIHYYIPYNKSHKHSYVFLVILSLPFVIIILEILLNRVIMFSSNSLIPLYWNGCFTEIINDKNVKGIWDYECGANQTRMLQYVLNELQNNFRYVNYALFFLIITSTKILSHYFPKKLSNSMITFICISLLIGTIGVLPNSFSVGYQESLMLVYMFSTLLNMNITAFLIVLYAYYQSM